MAYHVVSKRKGRKYHYMVRNIRVEGGWKKFSVYIGKGELSEGKIKHLMEENAPELKERVDHYLRKTDPLYTLISSEDAAKLQKVKEKAEKSLNEMPEEAKRKYYEWFVTAFTYDTNAIEGSTVGLDETGMILFEEIVPKGKSLREIKEVENHKRAFDYAMEYERNVCMEFILEIHRTLTEGILKEGAGELRKVQVFIRGVDFIPPPPDVIEKELKELLRWYGRNKGKYHPVILTSYFHAGFEGIHPFVDFNGRTGRILLNFILKKTGYPLVNIKKENRLEYYAALHGAQEGDLKPFIDLIKGYIIETRV
ncbi:MAG: Fic family protein [Candidatus Hydrothermarchaeaceae archaeon]